MENRESSEDFCGLIMPISAIDGRTEAHWRDVKEIVSDAVLECGLKPRLVSEDDEIGIIHKRIVQNLYNDALVICDVSAKNPNVMFELGIRLAFDKPTIVIKDDDTTYSFDTGSIEHVQYPRDLRYQDILVFKNNLMEKIRSMTSGRNEHSFLKSFGTFHVARIEQESVGEMQLIADEIASLRKVVLNQEIKFRNELHAFKGDTRNSGPGFIEFRIAMEKGNLLVIATPRNLIVNWPSDMKELGNLLQFLKLPDGSVKALVESAEAAEEFKRRCYLFAEGL